MLAFSGLAVVPPCQDMHVVRRGGGQAGLNGGMNAGPISDLATAMAEERGRPVIYAPCLAGAVISLACRLALRFWPSPSISQLHSRDRVLERSWKTVL